MLLADTSAWIEYLRRTGSPTNVRLRRAIRDEEVLLTDPVVYELMAGVRPNEEDKLIRLLNEQHYEPFASRTDWLDAADIYRNCRRQGVTIRAHTDVHIATVAIRMGVPVLQHDRDYPAIARCTALQLVDASTT